MRCWYAVACTVTCFIFPFTGNDGVEAATTARVCNQSTTGMWVGFGTSGDDKSSFVTTGWRWADPDHCTDPVALRTDSGDVYVYANSQGDDVEWEGTKALCVSMDGDFEYDHAEARPCTTQRLFKKYVRGPDGNLSVSLRDEGAVRVAYRFALCNKTDDRVTVAIGNESGSAEGLVSSGWYPVEPHRCETYIRRGKHDQAYFYAQTRARRLVWYGDVPMCVRYHEDFTLANSESAACSDGDSLRLPFVKRLLVKGQGSYDLTKDDAHVFKHALNLCNGYYDDVFAAIAHLDGIWMNGMVARGFWRLHPGECKLVDAVSPGPVYLYAETAAGNKAWTGSDLAGCVRGQGFTFPRVDRYACKGEGERRAGFFTWNVSEGANVYKFE